MGNWNCDIIVSWPDNMDYPLFRDFLATHKQMFNKVYIVFTKTNLGVDYTDFVEKSLKDERIVFIRPPELEKGQDWRDQAVNLALAQSKAEWVWFVEQDLFVLDPAFWGIIRRGMAHFDVIGYNDGTTRFHPSNLWVKRSAINNTRKDFGILPDKLDHFAKFTFDLRQYPTNQIMHLKNDGKWFLHMNGLSSNLSQIQADGLPNYEVEVFNTYIKNTLEVEPLDDRYKQMCETYIGKIEDESTN